MERIDKPLEQWRRELSPERFHVCRMGGTETPFGGRWYLNDRPGRYLCGCCGLLLFLSRDKFDSGAGWPCFSDTAEPGAVATRADHSHGRARIEALCARCGAHLGHVFRDGPPPTGNRFCVNSVALEFEPEDIESGRSGPEEAD